MSAEKTNQIITAGLLVTVAVSAFAIGRLSAQSATRKPVTVERTKPASSARSASLVGSEHSDKFHYPWCPGARRINRGNMVYFESIDEARKRGYQAAENCPGLTGDTT